ADEARVAAFAQSLDIEPEEVDQETVSDYLHESYALSLETDNRQQRVRLVFCTGGPHYEVSWVQGRRGTAGDVLFIARPWFDYLELRPVPDSLQAMADYWADLVDGTGGVE